MDGPRPGQPDPLRATRREELARRRIAGAAAGRAGSAPRPAVEIPLAAPAVRSAEVAVGETPLPRRRTSTARAARPRLAQIWRYLNPQMLYGKHLGLRGSYCEAEGSRRSRGCAELEQRRSRDVQAAGWIRARAIYRFFERGPPRATPLHAARAGRREAALLHVPAAGRGRAAVPRRLRRAARTGDACDSRRALRHDGGRRACARARRSCKDAGRIPPLPRAAGARHRDGRGRGRVAAREAPRATWGFPDPPEPDDRSTASRRSYRGKRVQLRLPGLPRAGRPGRALPAARRPQDRRRAHRGLHDGSRGLRLGARLPPPAGPLLRRRAEGGPSPAIPNFLCLDGLQKSLRNLEPSEPIRRIHVI